MNPLGIFTHGAALARQDTADYPIIRSARRRTLAIHIRHGEVTIRAPERLALATIHQFVDSRKAWIAKMLSRDAATPPPVFEDGVILPIMGRDTRINWLIGSTGHIQIGGDSLVIPFGKSVKHRSVYALKKLDTWLLTQANDQLPQQVSQAAMQLGVAHRLRHITFKTTRSKWGHCTHQGDIQLHPRIMMAPRAVQHYLVVHEVAHLSCMNHSADFWNLVARLDPDYKANRLWLKTHQHKTLSLQATKRSPEFVEPAQ